MNCSGHLLGCCKEAEGATNLELQMRPGPAACTGISGAEQGDRGSGRVGDGGASGGSGVREQGAELGERSRGRRQGGKKTDPAPYLVA